MRFFAAAFALALRRLLRRKATLACLLALPLLTLAMGLALPAGAESPVRIGIYVPDDSERGGEIWENLRQYSGTQLAMHRAESQAQLENMVAGGAWEYGYILPGDVDERIQQGRYARLITRVQSPASTMGAFSDWAVTAALLEACAPNIALTYLNESGIVPWEEQDALAGLLQQAFGTETLMQVDTVPVNGQSLSQDGGTAQLTGASLVRGLVALLMLLFSCLCALRFAEDAATGFFRRLGAYVRPGALFLPQYAAQTLLCGAAGLASLAIGRALFPGYFTNLPGEVGWLALYLVQLAAFSYFLAALAPKPTALAGLLPFLLIACLLLSPMIVDISPFLPAGRLLAALMPTTLYLRAGAGSAAALWQMPLAALLLFALGLLAHALRALRRRARA